tara:strand:- start:1043 stop:1357 length:315 start_codon:yes stop_codon:yes gene_type:complete
MSNNEFNNEFNNLDELNLIINIRIFQRNRKKMITLIEDLEQIEDFNFKKVNKYLKKKLCCNSTIKTNKKTNKKYIQLQGNHGDKIKDYLINVYNIDNDSIIIHG